MKRTYLVKKDPCLPVSKDNWIVMNAYEFHEFMRTEEGKKRRQDFGQMNACGKGDTIIIVECGKETARKWRAEKDCGDHTREMKRKTGWSCCSLSDLERTEEDSRRELLIPGTYYDMEEETFGRIEREKLLCALETLTTFEKKLISLVFFSDRTMSETEIGRMLGISRQNVRTLRNTIFEKLRNHLEKRSC